jgi:hypothetical protein
LQGEETARLGVGLALGLDLLAQSGEGARLARLSAGNVVARRKWTIRTGAESS